MSVWTKATVASITDVTPSICEILLEPVGGPGDFIAGSHLDVRFEADTRQEVRTYSLVGLPQDKHYRIAVKKEPGGRGGSLFMHALVPGDTVEVSIPQNNFAVSFGRPEYLLIAGGVGITPLLGMALALKQSGASFRLIYAVREAGELAFRQELDAQLGAAWEEAVSSEGTRLDLRAALESVAPDGEVYVCGPMRLLEEARREWRRMDRPSDLLRFESFATSGQFPAVPFKVELPHLGIDVDVGTGESMLDAMERAGVDVMSGCRRGECGLCMISVIKASGAIDHRDVFLSEGEKNKGSKMCACVSRAVGGTIVVDNGYQESHPLL